MSKEKIYFWVKLDRGFLERPAPLGLSMRELDMLDKLFALANKRSSAKEHHIGEPNDQPLIKVPDDLSFRPEKIDE